ncbi:P-loop containing nucleoside triphosphate hydrolase protein [Phlebopus sp. FC_14]|nr:P-loop containing nucleoside triphosphate hydrolase protein [Phlebopus sp. FC_14]
MVEYFIPTGLLGTGLSEPSLQIPAPDARESVDSGLFCDSLASTLNTDTDLVTDDLNELKNACDIDNVSRADCHESTCCLDNPPSSKQAEEREAATFDGKTLYIKRKARVTERRKLLEVPMHRLLEELSSSAALNVSTSSIEKPLADPDASPEDTLWVDRYRPRRFTELLGNERVAREVMAWVKQWDWCVFGKKRNKKRTREDDASRDPEDEYHRPREKLLLISGPPGLGKTTLAHVVAKHAGYEVMEVNASDMRSAQVIDDRIRPALESGAAVGSSKPVLLIIDEIDGATGGGGDNSSTFIQKLVSLTLDKSKKRRKGRDQRERWLLLRPIICICNDQHAHALTKLRPHARQVRYTRPADVHIIKRLREICKLEGLNADGGALNTLVGVAKGDLRGCLNTLQFIKSRSEDVTEPLIHRATVGMKEADTTIMAVLNEIFAPLSRKRVRDLVAGGEEEGRYVNRLTRAIEGLNNSTGIANGCFAHYTNYQRHQATLSRYEKADEWLGTFDLFSTIMYTDGDFGLHTYLPYFLVPLHPLCSERSTKRIERDSTDWDNLQLTRANEGIYVSLCSGIRTAGRTAGAYRHLVTGQVLQLEFVPYINRIISPPLRPVNSQVIKPGERSLLSRLVEIMVSLELRFVQERAEDGQIVYRLDPPIDVFVTYDGKRAADIAVSRYAVRHLVAAEIDATLIARQADTVEKNKWTSLRKSFPAHEQEDILDQAENDDGEVRLQRAESSAPDDDPINKRARRQDQAGMAEKLVQPPVDFFGRPITIRKAPGPPHSRARPSVHKEFQTVYRHLEGNSAAVRKSVKVASFV